jgi:hypothetical protein
MLATVIGIPQLLQQRCDVVNPSITELNKYNQLASYSMQILTWLHSPVSLGLENDCLVEQGKQR